MSILAGVGSIIGGLGGLFGKKPKQPDIADNIRDQAWGARQAAEKFGFNPLTMLQFGNPAGAGMAAPSAPPLASIAAITDGLKDINDVTSGDAARRRQADQLEMDLARVRLDQAKAGISPGFQAIAATSGVGNGPSPLGRRASTVAQVTARPASGKFSQGENPIAPGRKEDIAPLVNSPGVFEMENELTPFGPVVIPGEGEPWGIDELATGLVVGVPQVVGGALDAASTAVKDRFWDGKPALEYYRDKSAEKAETPEGKAKKSEFDKLLESQSYRNPYRNR